MRATLLCMLLSLLATCCSLNIKAAHAQPQMSSDTSVFGAHNKSVIGHHPYGLNPSTLSTLGNIFMKMPGGLFNLPIGFGMKSNKKRSLQSSNEEIPPRRAPFHDQATQENKTTLLKAVDINSRLAKSGGRLRIGGKIVNGTSNGTIMAHNIKLPAGFRPAPAPPNPMLYPFVEERMPLQRQQSGVELATKNLNTDDWRPIVFKHIPTSGMEKLKEGTEKTAQVRRVFESAEEQDEQDEPEQPAQLVPDLTDLINPVILEAMREKVIYGAPKTSEDEKVSADLMQQDAVVHDVDYYQAVAKTPPVVLHQAQAEIFDKPIQFMGEYFKIEERTAQQNRIQAQSSMQKTTMKSQIEEKEKENKNKNSTPSTEENISFIIEKMMKAVRYKDSTDINLKNINKTQTENPMNEINITIETPTKLDDSNANMEHNHKKEQAEIMENDETTLLPAQKSTTTIPTTSSSSSSPLLLTTTTSLSTSAVPVETLVDFVIENDKTPFPTTTIKAFDAAQQGSTDYADPYSSTTEPSICVPMLVRESSSINPNELVDIERIVCFPLPPDMDFNLTGAFKNDDEDQMNQKAEENLDGGKELVAKVQILTSDFGNEFKSSKSSKSCRLARNLNMFGLCWLILRSSRVLLG